MQQSESLNKKKTKPVYYFVRDSIFFLMKQGIWYQAEDKILLVYYFWVELGLSSNHVVSVGPNWHLTSLVDTEPFWSRHQGSFSILFEYFSCLMSS